MNASVYLRIYEVRYTIYTQNIRTAYKNIYDKRKVRTSYFVLRIKIYTYKFYKIYANICTIYAIPFGQFSQRQPHV